MTCTQGSVVRRVVGVLAVAVLFAGCSSSRVMTTMDTARKPVPVPDGTTFNIVKVSFVAPTNVPSGGSPDFGVHQPGEAELRSKLMTAARGAYPRLFSEKEDAIPVEVSITRTGYEDKSGGIICVGCLTLTILPMRTSDKTDYAVQVKVDDAGAGARVAAPVEFSREETTWLSLFPTGWIPVPGGRGDRAWGTDSMLQMTGDKMIKSVAEAVATALRRPGADGWSRGGAPVK